MREEKHPQNDQRLFETLTPREQDVLRLLAQRISNKEIAEKLTLAVTSVKWYVQQIYGKLGVDNRENAIQRARKLGLLEAEPAVSISPAAPAAEFGTFLAGW